MKNIFQEKNTVPIIITISVVIFLLPFILFLWKRSLFDLDSPADEVLLGTIGDFIGGVIGSVWALVGVILFYWALREQRKDIVTNKEALTQQIEALKMQTQEFSFQKDELKESRKVFLEQSKTLKKQQFESTFFSILKIYSDNINVLNSKSTEGSEYFVFFNKKLADVCDIKITPTENHEEVKAKYGQHFFEHKDDLSHYFKIVYRIIKFIENSSMTTDEKVTYFKILRSQFSEKELLTLYYNSYTFLGAKFCSLILKYNLLKHLPFDSKIEFSQLITNDAKYDFNRLSLMSEIFDYLHYFIESFNNLLQAEINENDFPLSISMENSNKSMIIQLQANELMEVKLSLITIKEDELMSTYGMNLMKLNIYVHHYLYHKLIFSSYKNYVALNFSVGINQEKNNIIYTIKSNKAISF